MLRIFRPDEDDPEAGLSSHAPEAAAGSDTADGPDDDGPVILSFVEWVERLRGDVHSIPAALLRRARALQEAQRCPDCAHARVIPLELRDGRLDGSGQIIPGTSTLVGFRCEHCRHEWRA